MLWVQKNLNEINQILGYPRYDPHGDPIPTETGELPPNEGIVLNEYQKSVPAVIIHIEDEPKSIYKEIIDKNINEGFKGCGMLIINAPYQLDEKLSIALPLILEYLGKKNGEINLIKNGV